MQQRHTAVMAHVLWVSKVNFLEFRTENSKTQVQAGGGKGSIMKLGENSVVQMEAISTGSLGLDIALGIGGLPRGRIIEIYGPESSGKTTLTLHAVAQAQKEGGVCAFIDAEHALDPVYAKKLGVNIENLLISQPDAGEQALEIADTLVRSGAVDLIVIDSWLTSHEQEIDPYWAPGPMAAIPPTGGPLLATSHAP